MQMEKDVHLRVKGSNQTRKASDERFDLENAISHKENVMTCEVKSGYTFTLPIKTQIVEHYVSCHRP